MLSINSITKGIVIDHIKPGLGIEIFRLLGLAKADYTVALIINATSTKYGRKDMIKIENIIDIDLNILKLLDKDITINIIEDGAITQKLQLIYPEKITTLISCTNPRCITTSERNIQQRLTLVDKDKVIYRCDYCEHEYKKPHRS